MQGIEVAGTGPETGTSDHHEAHNINHTVTSEVGDVGKVCRDRGGDRDNRPKDQDRGCRDRVRDRDKRSS